MKRPAKAGLFIHTIAIVHGNTGALRLPGLRWLKRRGNDLLVREIDLLRRAVSDVMLRHPFRTHGWVVLPDHLHCVIELPDGDTDFPVRWRLIKGAFSKGLRSR
ncbi:hypothetical protein [Lysobacter soli]|uniref:hypothetical protein n=1 Tax=Lysobacter soli TaxID=453783 RepID=UPI0011C04EE6|nr:hypothetical protein [Lysobacter soli]